MEELDFWRLCEELNIVQATLLVIGEDASVAEYAEGWDVQNRPKGYEAAKTAICAGLRKYIQYEKESYELEQQAFNLQAEYPNAPDNVVEDKEYLSTLFTRSITGVLVPESDHDINGHDMGFIEGTIDVYKSMVNVDSLKQWLRYKGVSTGFFFPEPVGTMDFLDPHNPRYAPKLAASVKAWQAVTDAGSKSPKQALNKWLCEHAAEFNLTNDEGKPIEQAIEDCSKVANWKQTGGAPKTPS
jgi:hypothetical protein